MWRGRGIGEWRDIRRCLSPWIRSEREEGRGEAAVKGEREWIRRGSECCGGRSERGSSVRRTAIRGPSCRPLGTGSFQSS